MRFEFAARAVPAIVAALHVGEVLHVLDELPPRRLEDGGAERTAELVELASSTIDGGLRESGRFRLEDGEPEPLDGHDCFGVGGG